MLDAMQVLIHNQKQPIPEMDKLFITEKYNATILDGLPDKMGDPGVLTISCLLGTWKFDQALCDIGASVSVMPKVIYDKLNQDSLVPTSMHPSLVDQLIRRPVRITEDILVRIINSFVPMDFVVLKMVVCHQIPLGLGRSFLSTIRATIDVAVGILWLNISGKEETFTFKPKGTEQCNQVRVSAGPKWKNSRTHRKKLDTAKYSTSKSICHVKNARPTVPLSPVTPAK
jgi:hypothetical protein